MGFTPTTGQTIAIGKVWAAMDNNNSRSYPPAGGTAVTLRGTLGAQRSRATVVATGLTATNITSGQISLGADFWNLNTPDVYP